MVHGLIFIETVRGPLEILTSSLNFCPNFSSEAPKFGNFQLTSPWIWKFSAHKPLNLEIFSSQAPFSEANISSQAPHFRNPGHTPLPEKSWILPNMQAETNANKMRPQSSRAVQHFVCVYLQAQTEVRSHMTNHNHFDCGKTLNTPIWAPRRGKDGTASGISGLYLWFLHNSSFN